MLEDKLRNYINSLGLDTFGFIKCREFYELRDFYIDRKNKQYENEFEEKDIEKRVNPNIYMDDGRAIISIAFPYFHNEIMADNGLSIYTKGFDYHRVVNCYLEKICEYIKEHGGKAEAFVDSNSLPERYIAYLAGVGFVGKNNMIITEKYGSYVFLGEIITDLDIGNDDNGSFKELIKYQKCGECVNCLYKCPTKSINPNKINPNICSSYITQKKELSDIEIKLMKDKVFGCDICQLTCPYNEKIDYSKIEEFKPLSFMNSDDLVAIASMNNKFFKEKLSKTSCGWRGKNILKRNAINRLFNMGQNIERFKGESPYINGWIERLIEIRGRR